VPSLLSKSPNWPVVDPLLVALPLSLLALVVVSSVTKKPSEKLLAGIFARN
jgi:SSS family solute:Na+ symporter